MYDDILLFSLDGGRAVEVTHGGFAFDDETPPKFENAKVTKPVPVMVEGTYHIYDPHTKGWRKTIITAEDIQEYLDNTPRDVAINYDHRRGGEAKGWLRLKDTARIAKISTRSGEKTALFAAIELFEPAARDVQRGYFRDVSIELKPVSKEIIGTALTSYPIMRDVQMYADVASEVEEAPEVAVLTDDQPTTQEFSMTEMTPEQRQEVLAEALKEFGLVPDDLGLLKAAAQEAHNAKQEARFAQAQLRVQELAGGEKGDTKLAPGAVKAAAQLLLFCEDHAELQFSVDGENHNPEQLLAQVFAGIEAVQVFGQVVDEEGDLPAEVIADPPTLRDTDKVDPDRVASLTARLRSAMQAHKVA